MKLVFPNGEHGQVFLSPGVNRIGSSTDGVVVLHQAGIQPVHCEIHLSGTGANLQVPASGGPVTVNGKPVTDLMALRTGDQLGIGPVNAKYLVVEAARSAPADALGGADDSGATRVRMAVPKYMLRGVSGTVFGKVFPVGGPVVIGRAPECDISVASDEISRRHAMVKPTPDGVSVEDLGSSNGTFVNNKRIQHGFLNAGDELRLDTVRFILVVPGMDMTGAAAKPTVQSQVAKPSGASAGGGGNPYAKYIAIMLILAAVAVIATLVITR